MGKSRQRNHETPRFLLNRFASRVEGAEKRWVWRIGCDGSVRELSTRDVGVSKRFYGDGSTGVEDALAIAEGPFSEILASIDGGRAPEAFSEELRQLFWTLAARTRAIRKQLATVADALLFKLAAWSETGGARDEAVEYLQSTFDERVEKIVAPFSPEQRRRALALARAPAVREQFLKQAMEHVRSNFGPMVGLVVRMVQDRGILPSSVREAQINSLASLLSRGAPPDGFKPEAWHVISADRHSFNLGDGCVFAKLKDGGLCSLLKDSKNWSEVYLPISDRQVLVATRGRGRPSLDDATLINQASACLSSDYIYSSCCGTAARDLIALIGTREPLLSQDELTEIVTRGFRAREV